MKNRPMGILIIPVFIILFILYYYYPIYTGTWENFESIFTFSGWALFVWFDIFLTIVAVYAVTYGFYKVKNWSRLYIILYLSLSSFWALISMYVMKWQVYEHYFYLIIYVVIIIYLLMSHVKEYFGVIYNYS
jgi:hypothetical protein